MVWTEPLIPFRKARSKKNSCAACATEQEEAITRMNEVLGRRSLVRDSAQTSPQSSDDGWHLSAAD